MNTYLINISKIEPYGRWTCAVSFKDIKKDALIAAAKFIRVE